MIDRRFFLADAAAATASASAFGDAGMPARAAAHAAVGRLVAEAFA